MIKFHVKLPFPAYNCFVTKSNKGYMLYFNIQNEYLRLITNKCLTMSPFININILIHK